jgi:hypothetical protein
VNLAAVSLGCTLLLQLAPTPARPVPVYTEEDLQRVHPHRGDTGVLSVPAVAPGAAHPASPTLSKRDRSEPDDAGQEAFWRREYAHHRQKVARLSKTAAALRRQIAERQREREPGNRRRGSISVAPLQGRLAEVEAEIQAAETEFEERSRRAGALPGWLR